VYIGFSDNFDHSSYSKNYASIIYFVCYVLCYCRHFKFDLPFYVFAIIFLNKTNGQSYEKKATSTNVLIRREHYFPIISGSIILRSSRERRISHLIKLIKGIVNSQRESLTVVISLQHGKTRKASIYTCKCAKLIIKRDIC
jgi:hypothetical protein